MGTETPALNHEQTLALYEQIVPHLEAIEKADEAMRTIIRQAMTIEQAENVAIDFLWWRQKSASPVPQNGEI